MNTYGIAYKVGDQPNGDAISGTFSVCIAYAESDEKRNGFIRLPRQWFFPLPRTSGFKFERFGASETRGLFGGLGDEQQRLYSETYERAISDVVTMILCEIVHGDKNPSEIRDILILGPALPKLVGRLASLRLPNSLKILFICPIPFPSWIAKGVDEKVIFPYYLEVPPVGEGWDEEALIEGCLVNVTSSGNKIALQQLRGVPRQRQALEQAFRTNWPSLQRQIDAPLPKEVVASVGHISHHIELPYTGTNASHRPIEASKQLYEVRQAGRKEPGGWLIKWLPD